MNSLSNPLRGLVYILSLNVVKRVYILRHSWKRSLIVKLQFNFPMQNPASIRRQLIADILDSHLSFEAVRATTEWDELTCLEQMTLEDLIDM